MRWVKASERIPNESKGFKKWRDSETKNPISYSAVRSAIRTDQKEFVEWLDKDEGGIGEESLHFVDFILFEHGIPPDKRDRIVADLKQKCNITKKQ
jgi:hypothetical protein